MVVKKIEVYDYFDIEYALISFMSDSVINNCTYIVKNNNYFPVVIFDGTTRHMDQMYRLFEFLAVCTEIGLASQFLSSYLTDAVTRIKMEYVNSDGQDVVYDLRINKTGVKIERVFINTHLIYNEMSGTYVVPKLPHNVLELFNTILACNLHSEDSFNNMLKDGIEQCKDTGFMGLVSSIFNQLELSKKKLIYDEEKKTVYVWDDSVVGEESYISIQDSNYTTRMVFVMTYTLFPSTGTYSLMILRDIPDLDKLKKAKLFKFFSSITMKNACSQLLVFETSGHFQYSMLEYNENQLQYL